MDTEIFKRVLAAFERERVEYIVVGAVALNLLGLPRATEDLDVFLRPERANIERAKAALKQVFSDPAIDEISSEELLGDYPAVQYIPPEGDFHFDLLTRLGEAFRYEDLEPMRVDFEGLEVTVVTPQTLHRMKKGTVRPKDWGDAENLQRRFQLPED